MDDDTFFRAVAYTMQKRGFSYTEVMPGYPEKRLSLYGQVTRQELVKLAEEILTHEGYTLVKQFRRPNRK